MILHIPHSSTHIPFTDGFIDDEQMIQQEINLLIDWYTDELFSYEAAVIVKADFSRIFCDVERFPDDKDEVMAKVGMGVCYTRTDDGRKLRVVSDELKKKILNEYYWQHHRKLEQEVDNELREKGRALILDCHSFPDIPFKRDLDQNPDRPDINIGTESFHTPTELINFTFDHFKRRGLNVQLDKPYSGTIVPLKYYQKNSRVYSIMLEVNRVLYLKKGDTKNQNYSHMKSTIHDYLKLVNQFIDEEQ